MKKQFNSRCVECGTPCFAPRGNFNVGRVTLCKSKDCRRKRKTAIQKNRRRQQILAFVGGDARQAKLVIASDLLSKRGFQVTPAKIQRASDKRASQKGKRRA